MHVNVQVVLLSEITLENKFTCICLETLSSFWTLKIMFPVIV